MTRGRFAPSPTGDLHVGNLRTALAAWGSATSSGGDFLVRWEDLDRHNSSAGHAEGQLRDLASIGIESCETPVFQSERFALYHSVVDDLTAQGLTYECFCSRKDIREAAEAPHGGVVRYPGTCRTPAGRERMRGNTDRLPALRLRGGETHETFTDLVHGNVTGVVDDIVLRRNDGIPAYNLAVVVDDAAQEVTQVVRGDDLLGVTPSQVHLQRLLGYATPVYAHVPLVVGADGERLSKRHGAVTLADLAAQGVTAAQVREVLWESLGQRGDTWNWDAVPRTPWVWEE